MSAVILLALLCLGVLLLPLWGFTFAWLWNHTVPIFWQAAPHLTMWQGLAIVVFIGFVRWLFSSKR